MEFANIELIESVQFSLYRTCRGYANEKDFRDIVMTIVNENSNEDDRDDAINEGLWDLFSHQYSLYSATPLALYLVLTLTTRKQRETWPELQSFVDLCKSKGSDGINLTLEEEYANNNGKFPIYSIEDVLRKYA